VSCAQSVSFFFQAEDGIRDFHVTGVQTCALPICRDAIGQLRIGSGPAAILVDFALEAKCYALESAVGVREISRLISRLRHRQFEIGRASCREGGAMSVAQAVLQGKEKELVVTAVN